MSKNWWESFCYCRGEEETHFRTYFLTYFLISPRNLLLSYFWVALFSWGGFWVLWLTRAVTMSPYEESLRHRGRIACDFSLSLAGFLLALCSVSGRMSCYIRH